jgi:hypothetical protein
MHRHGNTPPAWVAAAAAPARAQFVRDHRRRRAENRIDGEHDYGVGAPVAVEVDDIEHRGDGGTRWQNSVGVVRVRATDRGAARRDGRGRILRGRRVEHPASVGAGIAPVTFRLQRLA